MSLELYERIKQIARDATIPKSSIPYAYSIEDHVQEIYARLATNDSVTDQDIRDLDKKLWADSRAGKQGFMQESQEVGQYSKICGIMIKVGQKRLDNLTKQKQNHA